MIEIRITLDNGQDVWLAMPSSPEEMAEAYAAFGNAVNEGKQIRDAKSPVGNLSGHLRGLTVTSRVLEELAFLNQRIEGMTDQEREIFGAMLEIEKPYSVMEMVNLSCNMDKFVHYPEITDEALLGEYVLKKNYSQTPQELVALLDYESVGRNYARRHAGVFSENGYTVRTGQALEPLYDGQHLPDPGYEKNSLLVLKIYGKEYSPSLYLPAPESKISAMEKNLGVSSLDDCSGLSIQENVQGLKNRLPCGISVRELNRFVRELQQTLDGTKEQLDKLFMALEAEAPASADEAVRIARELEQYQVVLSPGEFHAPSDYAHKVLGDSGTYYVDSFTADFVDYEALGRAMMREDGAVMTSFGIAVRNDHTIRQRPEERTTFRLFSPLAASQEERGDWGEATGRMRELEGDELCSYGTEIMEAVEKENQYLNQERGLAEYIDNLILNQKVYSMKPTVDTWDDRLWGVLEVQTYGTLSEGEMKELMSEWSGQESDSWGEGFEQREIKTADGDLYVSFWQSGDNFFIKTEQELKNQPEQSFGMQMA